MPTKPPAPPTDPATQPTISAAAPLSLEERLALVNTAMSERLNEAAVAYEVNTAHIDTQPLDLADIVTGPIDTGPARLPDLYATPVAAVLQRAHQRLVTGGWCSGALVDADGARCMLGAIRIEAGGDRRLEADAASVLLDTIRRHFGDDVDSVPSFNDAHGNGRVPLRMLGQAAGLADARSL
ncbi:hypothetical protein [Streptomyces sp. NPDC127038]|uniref:DUF6197 family protein n=1 Tax=Streptomyces sp. NPDC127038 TaxID=3347114 RepID=UPI003646ECE6